MNFHAGLQPKSSRCVERQATRLALGNYLSFVLDSGSTGRPVFCLSFILSFLKSFVGVCKSGFAEILLKLLGAELPGGQDFKHFFISRARHH